MRRAFSLIELLIAVTLLGVMSGGGFLILNRNQAKNEFEYKGEEIINLVKRAQNSAKTRELAGTATTLLYIKIEKDATGQYLLVRDSANREYSKLRVAETDISFSLSPTIIYFWPGSGAVVTGTVGTPMAVGNTASISLSQGWLGVSKAISIDSQGQVWKSN